VTNCALSDTQVLLNQLRRAVELAKSTKDLIPLANIVKGVKHTIESNPHHNEIKGDDWEDYDDSFESLSEEEINQMRNVLENSEKKAALATLRPKKPLPPVPMRSETTTWTNAVAPTPASPTISHHEPPINFNWPSIPISTPSQNIGYILDTISHGSTPSLSTHQLKLNPIFVETTSLTSKDKVVEPAVPTDPAILKNMISDLRFSLQLLLDLIETGTPEQIIISSKALIEVKRVINSVFVRFY